MKIILIGFMCCGKSTIAKLLGERLNCKVIEIDTEIEKMAGVKTSDIFKQQGELGFRELEIAITKSLQEIQDVIISTGGGIVMNKINIDYLQKNSITIFLEASFETLMKRLDPKDNRPLFSDKQKARQLFDFRKPLYKAYANFSIVTDNKSPVEIVNAINIRLQSL